jgi:MtN3 and saliva related transmembrane protein
MDGSLTGFIGSVAAGTASLSLLPQVLKTWRTRSARDLSLTWLIVALFSMSLWIAYGVLLPAWSVVVANALTTAMALLLLIFKLRYG